VVDDRVREQEQDGGGPLVVVRGGRSLLLLWVREWVWVWVEHSDVLGQASKPGKAWPGQV
jgi:hypothetical protein